MNQDITLIATCTFGLEKMVRLEVEALGFNVTRVTEGRIEFDATAADIPQANLWLRVADRVLLKMAEFPAVTFEELFEQTKALPWDDWITREAEFTVTGRSIKSTLGSVRACQSIVKKAIVEKLKEAYQVDWFDETGPAYTVQVRLLKDVALLTIDTSGVGLHKRGYREIGGEAPLKETMAAALVRLSFWNKDRLLIDPMCGTGTILIEAALIAHNIAPGLKRGFASEAWPQIGAETWKEARRAAREAKNRDTELQLFGYDIDKDIISIAKQNARKAGVESDITFEVKDVKDLWIDQQYGVLISNPPYGVRLAEFQELNQVYISLNKTFRKKKGWSIYILTADRQFPNYFKRARPDRKRKLYNGTIEVNYYQYYGEKPPQRQDA